MKKIAIVILAAIILFMATACAPLISEGDVYDKEFKPAHSEVMLMPVVMTNGKTTMTSLIPYIKYYPDRWVIYIKAYDEEKDDFAYEDFYVTEEVYNYVNIGDYFVFDEDMGTREEPYTKERQ